MKVRIPKLVLEPYGVAYHHHRSPWAAMWWSVLLPGFGHFYVGNNLVGFVLTLWEAVINHQAHLNLAIYYSILGQGQTAAQVLDLKWAIWYPFIYLFAIFDAYRLAVEQNKVGQLEELQRQRSFGHTKLHPILGQNSLDKRNPLTAAFYGIFVGGLGHLYNMRFVKAAMLTAWQTTVVVLSHYHEALVLTFHGRPAEAAHVLDYQWLLFLPSIGLFNVINAYTDAVEMNSLYDEEWEWRWRKYIRNPAWPGKAAPRH